MVEKTGKSKKTGYQMVKSTRGQAKAKSKNKYQKSEMQTKTRDRQTRKSGKGCLQESQQKRCTMNSALNYDQRSYIEVMNRMRLYTHGN